MKVIGLPHPKDETSELVIIGENKIENLALEHMRKALSTVKFRGTFALIQDRSEHKNQLVFSAPFVNLIIARLIINGWINMKEVNKLRTVEAI